jgi:hypothetical protein
MNLYVRNIEPEIMASIRLNLKDIKKKGIPMSQSEYVNQLLKQALTSNFYEYKKDIFDQTIGTLTDKFEEFIESNNELLKLFAGIEEEDLEDEQGK